MMLLAAAMSLNAQITTSSMTGVITDDANEPLIGAVVKAVHVPSGTEYNAVTNLDGRFNIQGMRTGGPYTTTVSYIGYKTKTLTEITMSLGETYNLPVTMSTDANQLEEVVVVGSGSKFYHPHLQRPDHQPSHRYPQHHRRDPPLALWRQWHGFCWLGWPYRQLHR